MSLMDIYIYLYKNQYDIYMCDKSRCSIFFLGLPHFQRWKNLFLGGQELAWVCVTVIQAGATKFLPPQALAQSLSSMLKGLEAGGIVMSSYIYSLNV